MYTSFRTWLIFKICLLHYKRKTGAVWNCTLADNWSPGLNLDRSAIEVKYIAPGLETAQDPQEELHWKTGWGVGGGQVAYPAASATQLQINKRKWIDTHSPLTPCLIAYVVVLYWLFVRHCKAFIPFSFSKIILYCDGIMQLFSSVNSHWLKIRKFGLRCITFSTSGEIWKSLL